MERLIELRDCSPAPPENLRGRGRIFSELSASLSIVLCMGLEVGGDSVGVGGGELGEGLFPVGGGVSLDEACGGCSFVGGFSCVCEALGSSFVFDVADGEPQEFDGGFFAGEMPAILSDFAQLVVQGLDSVGGVHDAARHGRER